MPARVVLGAAPVADGRVLGKDVKAWVEVHVAGGDWIPLYDDVFMPDPSKKPDQQPPQQVQNTTAAAVPPPRTIRPRDAAADTGSGTAGALTPGHCASVGNVGAVGAAGAVPAAAAGAPGATDCGGSKPTDIWPTVEAVALAGSPLLALLAAAGLIAGIKARRRFLRRTRGVPANRVAAGWQEVLDRARDLGFAPPSGTTVSRRDQAVAIAATGASGLALAADAAVYGAHDPTEEQVAGFWRQTAELCAVLRDRTPRRRRLLAVVNISTLYGTGSAGRSPR
jgi:hypothetical protein